METVQTEGGRQISREVEFYNLDAVIAVGYRVNSIKATHFRIAERFNMGMAGSSANLLRDAREQRKHAILRDPFMKAANCTSNN